MSAEHVVNDPNTELCRNDRYLTRRYSPLLDTWFVRRTGPIIRIRR